MIFRIKDILTDDKLCDNKINVLTLENKDYFDLFIRRLNGQIQNENEWFELLDDDYKKLNFTKNVDVINSPVDLNLTGTQIKKKLYQNLAEDSEMNNILEVFQNAYTAILDALNQLNVITEHEITYSADFSLAGILKDFDVTFKQPEGRLIERLIDYITTIHDLLGKKVFFVINCDSFLEKEDYQYLAKFSDYNKVYLCLVESHQFFCLEDLNELIIDRDFCKIY